MEAVESLGKMGAAATSAVPALTDLMSDEAQHVREAIEKAIKQVR